MQFVYFLYIAQFILSEAMVPYFMPTDYMINISVILFYSNVSFRVNACMMALMMAMTIIKLAYWNYPLMWITDPKSTDSHKLVWLLINIFAFLCPAVSFIEWRQLIELRLREIFVYESLTVNRTSKGRDLLGVLMPKFVTDRISNFDEYGLRIADDAGKVTI